MFSIIIPTMWFSDKIHRNLSRLNDCEAVGEIILIDNNPSLKPKQIPSKVKYHTKGENIFVNPSWNWGVELSTYDNLCIANDDVVFDTDIFQFIQPYLGLGIFGMATSNYYERVNKPYNIKPIESRGWGWGCLLFVHKGNWIPIDERLKIACGDDWLFDKLGGFEISGLDLGDDKISTTSIRAEFFKQQLDDIRLWSQF